MSSETIHLRRDKRHATPALHANRGRPKKHEVVCEHCGETFKTSFRRRSAGPHYCFACRFLLFNQRSAYASHNALGYGFSALGVAYVP